ncbi:hypothetical protein BC629DRAFT_1040670 [Irpex lacteus]|nr:hypothetical protein BC629DRAFT_1040670 [Irpex lacteus]
MTRCGNPLATFDADRAPPLLFIMVPRFSSTMSLVCRSPSKLFHPAPYQSAHRQANSAIVTIQSPYEPQKQFMQMSTLQARSQNTGTTPNADGALEYHLWNSLNIELLVRRPIPSDPNVHDSNVIARKPEAYIQNAEIKIAAPSHPSVAHVSDVFNEYLKVDNILPNVIAFSSDGVFFLVHYHVITNVSTNNFNGLILPEHEDACNDLDQDTLELWLPETASQLNIVLSAAYGFFNDALCHPSVESLMASLDTMKKYGLPLEMYLAQGAPLFRSFLDHVPFHPFEIYAVAAMYNLEDLAAAASSYTLTSAIDNIPEHIVVRIGTRYFYRLLVLHESRLETLKAMFDDVLYPHTAKPYCSAQNRLVTGRAFHMAGMQIYFKATPGKSGTTE